MIDIQRLGLLIAMWIGHAYLWCVLLNALYGLPISKKFLKPWRLFTGLVILLWPLWVSLEFRHAHRAKIVFFPSVAFSGYLFCFVVPGFLLFVVFTLCRLFRRVPACVKDQSQRLIRYWDHHRQALLGDGKWRWAARLPFNDPFTVEFSELTLKLERLPSELEGLTILFLSDFHFCGTPSRVYFEAILDEIAKQPVPDVVALGGDFVDSLEHHAWLEMLARLKWKEAGLAILGNHDVKYDPDGVRRKLTAMGYRMLSGGSQMVKIRGVMCEAIGHEGPWFPAPCSALSPLGEHEFRLCLTHTPDNFYWAVARRINLVLAGHVHGGQIRLPFIGSIFCPSIYSRRFDQGVFQKDQTVMAVSRGLSGKEPVRFRCPAQVLRITLTRAHHPGSGPDLARSA